MARIKMAITREKQEKQQKKNEEWTEFILTKTGDDLIRHAFDTMRPANSLQFESGSGWRTGARARACTRERKSNL